MKRAIGITCMMLGILLLLGAGVLYFMNEQESNRAEESVQKLMPQVIEAIQNRIEPQYTENQNGDVHTEPTPVDPDFYSTEMTVEVIDGYEIVGYLTVPTLGLQLPVMSETTDALLKISPCRYYGSTKTDNLVIGGHNYWHHFGQLTELGNADTVVFTDMDGDQTTYELITMEILQPKDVPELTNGEYPLTLYTCTYGGATRYVLRFDIVKK